jgi:Uma2 family endonuclease
MSDSRRLLDLDDWQALDESRAEVVDGVLVIPPPSGAFHQLAVARLAYWLDEWLPDLVTVARVELLLTEKPLTVRVPDVLVASLTDLHVPRVRASDARLVIEVLSEGTVRTDRVTKFSEYAEVGIEHYWIVDLDSPTSMIIYRLVDGDYENFGEHTGKVTLEFEGTSLDLDLDALTARRAQRP